jgi:heme oxygenase (mycobilin-producing)
VSEEIRVLVYHAADDASAIDEAYHQVSRKMASVPGMLGNELLHSLPDPTGFIVMSRWANIDAFQEWEQGPDHLDTTALLRPFRDPRMTTPFGIYRVTARYT